MILSSLELWLDPVPRSGPENMAVDEWLLETRGRSVLRVYGWAGNWGSLGYFGNLAEARSRLPGLDWVRRWTGGGVVDHRADWTYTLAISPDEGLATLRGAESYARIHGAVVAMLREQNVDARLSGGNGETGGALCFQNPVEHDVMDGDGRKLAGAGQRRTRFGLLHQGSVAAWGIDGAVGGEALAGQLAEVWERVEISPPGEEISDRVARRYGRGDWTTRR